MKRILGIGFLVLILVLALSACKSSTTTPAAPKQIIKPTVNDFSVSPTSIWYKEDKTAMLSWSVTNATTVSIDQGIGTVGLTGTKEVKPKDTTTWTLTATNADGTVTASCKFEIKPRAYFTLVSYDKTRYTSYDRPKITGEVRNDGNLTGYNVMIEFQAYKGNTIIDTASGFPADLGDIRVGFSAVFEAVFFNLHRHYEYDSLMYKITWLNRSTMQWVTQTGRIF